MMHCARTLALATIFVGGCSSAAPTPPSTTRPISSASVPLVSASASASVISAVPVEIPEIPAEESIWTNDSREEPSNEKAVCEVANRNIREALESVLNEAPPEGRPLPREVWSGKTTALYQKLVEGRYGLTAGERALLNQNGFVVLGRLSRPSYAHAYHDIFQSQLPVYITMDSLFHVVFKAHEALMVHVEKDLLAPRVKHVVDALRRSLDKTALVLPAETKHDLALYLGVASSLLSAKDRAAPVNSLDPEIQTVLDQIEKANGLIPIDLFGRTRMVDFSQYRPRGYYDKHDALVPYFKAMMWLSRIELNLVSRSSRSSAPGASPDPRETPREAMMAVALGRLVEEAGVASTVSEVEDALRALGGKREDVSIAEIMALYKRSGEGKLGEPATFEALKREIGTGFVRTARIHYMPQGSTDLPVILSLFGPRITPDAAAQRPLVHGETPDRFQLQIADMAFALGHDRAREYLRTDLARFPTLNTQLEKARRMVGDIQGEDLYSTWLLAIRELSHEPPTHSPSFAKTKAFRDLRINSTVAAYGQLRRNNVLIAGQGYEEGGCEIPDGYVEPAPEALRQLATFAERASALLEKLGEPPLPDGKDTGKLAALFPRMRRTFRGLLRIVDREIAGQPLTYREQRLLATVAEIVPATSSSPPMYTGWYFNLFAGRRDALENPSFIGDYYTSTNTSTVSYAGAGDPHLGIFVVDLGGAPRMMVGPIASAYEVHAPLSQRLTDDEGKLQPNKESAWTTSYLVKKSTPPTLRFFEDETRSSEKTKVYKIVAKQKLGKLKVEYLTHHGQPCGEGQTTMGGLRGEIRVKLGDLPKGETCTGGYRMTVDGNVYGVDLNDFPYEVGLGDMWDMHPDEN